MPKKCDRLEHDEWPVPEQIEAIRDLGAEAARLRCEMDACIWLHVESGRKYQLKNIVWSSDSHEWLVIYRGEDRDSPAFACQLANWHAKFKRLKSWCPGR